MNSTPFGQGRGSTWLSNLECAGDEETLVHCLSNDQQRNSWHAQQCSSHAGILCLGEWTCVYTSAHKFMPVYKFQRSTSSIVFACTETDGGQSVQLVGGRNEREGRVEVFYEGAWEPVCASSGQWGTREAEVLCKELGLFENGELTT